MSPFVDVDIDWRTVHDLYTRFVQRPAEPCGDPLELRRVLREGGDHPGLPRCAPWNMKWRPMSVFPEPDGPTISVEAPGQYPGASRSSRAGMPDETRTSPSPYPASIRMSASRGNR